MQAQIELWNTADKLVTVAADLQELTKDMDYADIKDRFILELQDSDLNWLAELTMYFRAQPFKINFLTIK